MVSAFVSGWGGVAQQARSERAAVASRGAVGAWTARRCVGAKQLARSAVAGVGGGVRMDLESDVRAELNKLFDSTPCMPIMVRLAWHDAGTYDKDSKTGGANGSIRYEVELLHGANAGLKNALSLLEPIKAKYPDMSYGDLFQLASIQAIKYAGGPDIPFRMGRKELSGPELCTPDGRLPDADKRMPHLRDIFYRMGMTDKEIIALSGAHTLGRAHKDRSGFDDKPWTTNPMTFDNSYYKELLANNNPDLLRLISDEALMDEEEMLEVVKKYASDQDAFFADYAAAHQKLSELGAFQ
uniref:Plant heme peroxidase family profile domain-containing protein n=1 Tax=Erythrolobus australicus TaxID=1077150 RepID=A0A7S1TMY3_9RHOD|mmetsp:Transcript_4954/g.13333  ORF Transcript_4954/g.13333 Transcript_4954/m.13333 type:complete len:297 (+) Transcript_4954:46-936(+)